jgi:hypothetical protein
LLGRGHVHRELIADQHARELASSLGADHRQSRVEPDSTPRLLCG